MTPRVTTKPAWVQLYDARQVPVEFEHRSPGRPPSPIPRHKVGMTLSQGEINELQAWQERFSNLLNRKVSLGETVGILTRICTARVNRLSTRGEFSTLADLVEKLIG
ncbi:MAG: hypothetical protein WHV66_00480 [Anaerolineales bacterium]|jgi:hypothetical protein